MMSGYSIVYPRSFSITLPFSLNVSRSRQRPMVMMDICTIGLLKERVAIFYKKGICTDKIELKQLYELLSFKIDT